MHWIYSRRGSRAVTVPLLLLVIAFAVALVGASSANAASEYYCNGCYLGSNGATQSSPHGLSTLNYGHRLANAGSMIVYTWSNYYGQAMCSSGWTSATEATCSPGGYSVIGIVVNGSGGRSYNAHLNYG